MRRWSPRMGIVEAWCVKSKPHLTRRKEPSFDAEAMPPSSTASRASLAVENSHCEGGAGGSAHAPPLSPL